MGHSQSKSRKKGPTPTTSQRLYPNLSDEFSTFGRPNTVEYPPAYSQEACFGNTIPTWHNGQSFYYNPGPSAPPVVSAEVPAIVQSLAEKEDGLRSQNSQGSKTKDDRNPDRKLCSNARAGCILHFGPEQMEQHLKECLFRDIVCPMNGRPRRCAWQDKVKNIPTHFKDNHRENIGQVNKESTLTDRRTIQFVHLKPHKFMVHIKVDEPKKKILVAVQLYNTRFVASKWFFEFLFEYNGVKEQLHDTFISAGVPIDEKFEKLQCRVLHMNASVMQAFKNGGIKYKYRIMQKGCQSTKARKLEAK